MLLQPVFKSKEALPIGRLGELGERGCHQILEQFYSKFTDYIEKEVKVAHALYGDTQFKYQSNIIAYFTGYVNALESINAIVKDILTQSRQNNEKDIIRQKINQFVGHIENNNNNVKQQIVIFQFVRQKIIQIKTNNKERCTQVQSDYNQNQFDLYFSKGLTSAVNTIINWFDATVKDLLCENCDLEVNQKRKNRKKSTKKEKEIKIDDVNTSYVNYCHQANQKNVIYITEFNDRWQFLTNLKGV